MILCILIFAKGFERVQIWLGNLPLGYKGRRLMYHKVIPRPKYTFFQVPRELTYSSFHEYLSGHQILLDVWLQLQNLLTQD